MTAFVIRLRLFCLVPFATGLGDLLLGAGIFGATGVKLPNEAARDPIVNSRMGVLGSHLVRLRPTPVEVLVGCGRNRDLFNLLCGVLVLSGVGRAIAAAGFGRPSAPLIGAMAFECISLPLLVARRRLGPVIRRTEPDRRVARREVAADPDPRPVAPARLAPRASAERRPGRAGAGGA